MLYMNELISVYYGHILDVTFFQQRAKEKHFLSNFLLFFCSTFDLRTLKAEHKNQNCQEYTRRKNKIHLN